MNDVLKHAQIQMYVINNQVQVEVRCYKPTVYECPGQIDVLGFGFKLRIFQILNKITCIKPAIVKIDRHI